MPGKKLHVKCYIEGIEVPLNGAQINIATNQASRATLSIPPSNSAFKIRPRSHVHLFWYDDAGGDWYLLWEGEVMGIGFSKATNSRSVSLSCLDISNYWDYTLKMLFEVRKGVSYNRNILMFYGDTEATISIGGDPVLEKVWDKLSKKPSLPDAVYSLLQYMTDKLAYYNRVNQKMRLNSQLKMMPDDRIVSLVKNKFVQYLSQNMVGNTGDSISIRELILGFCSMVSYTHSCFGSPSFVGGALNSFLLKPNLFGCLPPRCNILFPDTCSSVQYGRSFMEEPTRAWLQAHLTANPEDSGGRAIISPFRTAPAYLAKSIVDIGKGNPKIEQVFNTFTDEELEKGIIPITTQIPYAELFAMKPGGKSFNDVYIQQYGDYMFQMSRYASRTLTVTTELNPWVVCDFPCAVFDVSRSFVANINQISHSIGADGGGLTQIDCTLARELDIDNDDSPYIPVWLSEAYGPYKVNGTYQTLLGCAALGDENSTSVETSKDIYAADKKSQSYVPLAPISGVDALRTNISKIAATVYSSAKGAKSKYQDAVQANAAYSFADAYRRRSLARMKDVLSYYNLSTTEDLPPSQFDGDMFEYLPGTLPKDFTIVNKKTVVTTKHKRAIVSAYAKEINKSHVLDGR